MKTSKATAKKYYENLEQAANAIQSSDPVVLAKLKKLSSQRPSKKYNSAPKFSKQNFSNFSKFDSDYFSKAGFNDAHDD